MNFVYREVDITPHRFMAMSGYLGKRMATGTLDQLKARILRVHDWVYINFDLVGVDVQFLSLLRERMPQFTIDVSATHTHSGPAGTLTTDKELHFMKDVFQDWDSEYVDEIMDKLVSAITKMDPMRGNVSYSKATLHHVGANRHDINNPFDDEYIVFTLNNSDQRIAVVKLALHPTFLKEDNTYYSKDLLSYTEEVLLKEYDGVMFVQGALGDVSTRFTRQGKTMEELGVMLAHEIILIGKQEQTTINSASRVSIPLEFETRWSTQVMIDAVGYHIGELRFLALPFEACSPLNEFVKKSFGVSLLSIHNGYLAYATPTLYYKEDQYESVMSIFNEGAIEKLLMEVNYEVI